MPESLLNFRCHRTTMPYDELFIALENIIIHKVSAVPTARNKNIDTSVPMKIGMAANGDGERLREEGQRIMDITLQAVCKGTGKGNCSVGQGR